MKRRDFLKTTAMAASALPFLTPARLLAAGEVVNDVHAQLNETVVAEILKPEGAGDLMRGLSYARRIGQKISISGARHAMGGQQFGTDTTLFDMRSMNKVVSLDAAAKIVEVESGIQWPQLIAHINKNAPDLCVIQKQTGADELTLGGALASNIHGRSLTKPPIISDIESFTLLMADEKLVTCSRDENAELFGQVIGGYGLFGIINTIKLRLGKRIKLKRVVDVILAADLIPAVESRVKDGYLYGDFQYMTDEKSDDFMRRGIFTCYLPVPDDTLVSEASHDLGLDAWKGLYRLAHLDKKRAYEVYRDHYLQTNNQIYWSDAHQTGIYLKDFNKEFAKERGEAAGSSLMLSEVYVPRAKFAEFMETARKAALQNGMDIIYGTVRFIQADTESFLPWAREDYACIIFNLYIVHTPEGIEKAKNDFRRLYDIALSLGGTYYLTYHRWALKEQVEKGYPKLPRLLALKRDYDPGEVFQSDWYRHYKKMFG